MIVAFIIIGADMFKLLGGHGFFNLSRAFIGAVLVVYLIGNGIDVSVIALAKALQLAVSVILNYPAGKLSDRFGNKVSITLACGAEVIYFALMINPTELKVICGEMFNGCGIALYAGSWEAWIFAHKNEKEDSFSLIARSSEILFIATVISGVVGAYFSDYSFFMSIGFMLISLLIYLLATEKRKPVGNACDYKKSKSDEIGVVKLIKKSDRNVFVFFAIAGMMQLVYQFWPLYFTQPLVFFTQKQIGYVFAISMMSQWLVTIIARKINFNKMKYASILCLAMIFVSSLFTILLPVFGNEWGGGYVLSYCLFLAVSALSGNFYFSRSCNLYSNDADESSMISLLDASARGIGAIALWIISVLGINNPSVIWSVFPAMVMLIVFFSIFTTKGKKYVC